MVQRLQAYDLSHPQFISLATLVAHGKPVSMSELSDVTLQDAPSMTRIVDRLVKMSLVQRTRDERDRRVVLVEATGAGRTLIETIKCDQDQEDVLGFSRLEEAELAKVEQLMDHLVITHLKQLRNKSDTDIEQMKEEMRRFAKDPIEFLRYQKERSEA